MILLKGWVEKFRARTSESRHVRCTVNETCSTTSTQTPDWQDLLNDSIKLLLLQKQERRHNGLRTAIDTFARTYGCGGPAREQLREGKIASALALEATRPRSISARFFFGSRAAVSATATSKSRIVLRSGGDSITLILNGDRDTCELGAKERSDGTDIIVGATARSCTVARCNTPGSPLVSACTLSELCADICLAGSLWDIIFPQHRAILVRTYGITAEKTYKGSLFKLGLPRWFWWFLRGGSVRRGGTSDEELALAGLRRTARRWRNVDALNTKRHHNLRGIDELFSLLQGREGEDNRIFQDEDGVVRFTRYIPPYSSLLHFEDNPPSRSPSRGDYVAEYRARWRKRFFSRDFVLTPEKPNLDDDIAAYKAMADLSNILAIRRSGLFQPSFSRRVYTVVLPPGVVTLDSLGLTVLLVPCLVAYRVPLRPVFRPTFTVSFVAIPVQLVEDEKRPNLSR